MHEISKKVKGYEVEGRVLNEELSDIAQGLNYHLKLAALNQVQRTSFNKFEFTEVSESYNCYQPQKMEGLLMFQNIKGCMGKQKSSYSHKI